MDKLKDIVLKKGDIIYYINNYGERSILSVNGYDGCSLKEFEEDGKGFVVTKIERPKYETIYEAPKPILDKEEKAYLEAVIRPFKDKVCYISKYITTREEEYISIVHSYDSDTDLPNFEKGTMYKGMKLNKDYTLKELGLFEGETK